MPITKICNHAYAPACACISGKIGLVVKIQNGGIQGSIAASKSLQYKGMPGNLTFLRVGVCERETLNPKMFKKPKPPM